MPQGDIIREFLVGLGFEVDKDQAKKFEGAIFQATKKVTEFAAAATATGIAIEAFVTKVASQMTDLYYASEKAGASAQNLDALRYAARTIGVDANSAAASIAALSEDLHKNPGSEGQLKQLGIQTRDANLELRDTHDIWMDLLQLLYNSGGIKNPIAILTAEQFGMPYDQFQQYMRHFPEMKAAEEEHNKRQAEAGVNLKELTEASRNFNNALLKLDDEFGLIADKIAMKFLPAATAVVNWAEDATEAFAKLNAATDGWAGAVTGVLTSAISVILAKGLLMRVLFRGAAKDAKAAAVAQTALATSTTAVATASTGALAAFSQLGVLILGAVEASNELDSIFDRLLSKPLDKLNETLFGMSAADNAKAGANLDKQLGGATPLERLLHGWHGGQGATPAPTSQSALDLKNYFISKGWSPEAASGILANINRESSFDPNAQNQGHYGLGQWDATRQAEFARVFGKDIHNSTSAEQAAFIQYELTQGSDRKARAAGVALGQPGLTGGGAAAIFANDYERFGTDMNELSKRMALGNQYAAGGGVTINQTTHIAVDGSSDPHATAAAIADQQNRVNGDIGRNVVGAMNP